MSDYKVSLGAELRTKELDKQVEGYNGKVNIGVNPDGIKSGIDAALKGYEAAPIEVGSTLNVKGINDKIDSLNNKSNRRNIKVGIDPDFTGVGTSLENYGNAEGSKALRVKVDINWTGVKGQIETPNQDIGMLKLNAELNNSAIKNAIRDFNNKINGEESKVKVRVKIEPNFKGFNSKIHNHKIAPIKIAPQLKTSELDKQISGYNGRKNKRLVQLNAKLADGAIENAVLKYTAKEVVPVNVNFIVGTTATVDTKIAEYKSKGAEVPVKLIPAQKDFDTKITNTPVKISATINKQEIQQDVESAVGGYTPTAKMPINIRLTNPKDINKQVKKLNKPTERISVGVKLDEESIKQEIANLNTNYPAKIGVKLDPDGIKLVKTQIDDLRQELENLESISINISGNTVNNNGNGSNFAQQTRNIVSNSAKKAIRNISSKEIEEFFEVSEIDSSAFEDEMNKLVRKWTKNKGNVVDIQIETNTRFDEDEQKNIEELSKAHVTYKNAANESIKKTLEWKQIGTEDDGKTPIMGWVEGHAKYRSAIEKTKAQTDKFVKQQKKAVGDLSNQINQLNRAATDQNASRPIKDQSHLNQLESKYQEITNAITAMGNASRDTFDDEQNRVKRLISEYKSMKSEFQNAENVANKLSGTDYQSGRKIAEQNLAEFKTKAKDYAQMSQTLTKLQASFDNVGDASSLKEFNNQLRVAKAELAKVKVEANAVNLGKTLRTKVSGLTDKISNFQKANSEIAEFKIQIDGAEISIESLLNDLGQVKTKGDFSVVRERFKAFTDAVKEAGIVVTNTATKVKAFKDIKNDIKVGNLQKHIGSVEQKFKRLGVENEAVEKNITELRRLLSSMDESDDIEAVTADYQKFSQLIEIVSNAVNGLQMQMNEDNRPEILDATKESAMQRLNGLFESGSQAAKIYGARAEELRNELNNVGNVKGVDIVNRKIKNLGTEIKNSKLQTQTLGSRLKEQLSRYSNYLSIASVFMYAQQAMRSMFEQVKLIDSAMTELKKVTNETDASYNQFLSNAASRAKELGTTIDGLVSSTADFARLGYGFKESQELAEVANIYAVVGDEIEGVEDATQSLVSTMAAFKGEMNGVSDSDFAMGIVDKMNEVSNNFAISSGGIGQALQRSASSMAAANNTLDETIAMITAANEVAQNPEKVGNAFKTMSMRIRAAKTEMEELGEDTTGMAESTASLRQEMLALSGVDIMLND